MPVMRIVLLLVVLGGLALLLAQNWAPVLPLVFLGFQTPALPMAAWILIALAAGAITSLFITSLFKLANLFTPSSPSKRRKTSPIPPPRPSEQRSEAPKTVVIPSQPNTASTSSDVSNDWDFDATTNDDDWDFGEDTDKTPNFGSQTTVRDSTTFESSQTVNSTTSQASPEPKSGYPGNSVYSYSYQEPRNSSVGKTESVYDADYRVIKPPYQQPDPDQENAWRFSNQPSEAPKTVARPSQPDSGSTPNNTFDDWDFDATTNDEDWDFEEDTSKTPNFGSQNTRINSRTYEVTTEPKSSHRSGSVYSYSYRESKNSGASKGESAYDANYRVIKPPAQKTDPVQDDEDWGFEDDDFEDEGESNSPR